MKKAQLKQLIKEEIQNEINLKTLGAFRVSSPEYKKFYQFIELSIYWTDETDSVNPTGQIYFDPLNDFYFFYLLWTASQKQNWTPNYCLLTSEDFENMIYDNGLDENQIQQVKDKFKEHAK